MPSNRASGPARIRQLNRQAVLGYIRDHGSTSRSALIPALELSAAAISSVVSELIGEGLLLDSGSGGAEGRGRPVSRLALNPGAAYALGLVVRTNGERAAIDAAWADYAGAVHVEATLDVNGKDGQTLAAGTADALISLERKVPDAGRIVGVSVGVPGVVVGRRIEIAPLLPALQGEAFTVALQRSTKRPIGFFNDVKLSTMAELGRQSRLRNLAFAYLHVGSGVGAGVALNGTIRTGHGWAGEVGQLKITRGRTRFTFEELLSFTKPHMTAQLGEIGLDHRTLDDWAAAIDARDKAATALANRYAADLCDLIQVLNAVLDLDEVVVDFPSKALFERLRPRIEMEMQGSALDVAVSASQIGHDAAVTGAALSALKLALKTVEQRNLA